MVFKSFFPINFVFKRIYLMLINTYIFVMLDNISGYIY